MKNCIDLTLAAALALAALTAQARPLHLDNGAKKSRPDIRVQGRSEPTQAPAAGRHIGQAPQGKCPLIMLCNPHP